MPIDVSRRGGAPGSAFRWRSICLGGVDGRSTASVERAVAGELGADRALRRRRQSNAERRSLASARAAPATIAAGPLSPPIASIAMRGRCVSSDVAAPACEPLRPRSRRSRGRYNGRTPRTDCAAASVRRNSGIPGSWSGVSAWWLRRMLRFEGDVFLLGTAIAATFNRWAQKNWRRSPRPAHREVTPRRRPDRRERVRPIAKSARGASVRQVDPARLGACQHPVADERVGRALVAEGRHRAVAGDEGGVIAHRPQALRRSRRASAGGCRAGSRCARSTPGTARRRRSRASIADGGRRHGPGVWPGQWRTSKRQVADRHRVAIDQPAVGLERLAERRRSARRPRPASRSRSGRPRAGPRSGRQVPRRRSPPTRNGRYGRG